MTDDLPDIPFRQVQNADGRRREVRLYRSLRRQLLSDMGGADDIPATRLAVVETLAQAAAIQRAEFAAMIADPSRDSSRFTGLSNLVIGASRTLGLQRIAKSVPSLHEYLTQRAAQDAQQDAQDVRSGAGDAEVAAQPSNAQEGAGAA